MGPAPPLLKGNPSVPRNQPLGPYLKRRTHGRDAKQPLLVCHLPMQTTPMPHGDPSGAGRLEGTRWMRGPFFRYPKDMDSTFVHCMGTNEKTNPRHVQGFLIDVLGRIFQPSKPANFEQTNPVVPIKSANDSKRHTGCRRAWTKQVKLGWQRHHTWESGKWFKCAGNSAHVAKALNLRFQGQISLLTESSPMELMSR